jgi:hypothetical protein
VTVAICVDTEQRATDYCPEVIRRPFPKGLRAEAVLQKASIEIAMQQRPKRYLGIRSEDRRPIQPREYGLLLAMGLAFAILIARLWYLQVLHGEELATRAELVRTRLMRIAPPRGMILDRAWAYPRH